MRTHVASIEISATVDDVVAFVADAEKLPVWAIGFAKAIDRDGDGWVVATAGGERVRLQVDADPARGVVDYVLQPAPGVDVTAATRAVATPGGAVYTFVMVQAPGMSEETFDAQIAELGRELTVLKAHLETSCPL
jgi:hypothetical protein